MEQCDAMDAKWQVVRVTDYGGGINEETRDRIFEPFFTTKTDGTGLGLCIAANIMARHRGRLVLECSDSNRTVFSVWLPMDGN
jgi:nitrogen-specific signal transduction histidine kinase